MKKKVWAACMLLLLCCQSHAANNGLQHVQGIHSAGISTGTGWGSTIDVGLSYQYYVHRRWSIELEADYERGHFKPYAGYQGFSLRPGAEAMVWQPCSWLYLHLFAHLLWGWDWWQNRYDQCSKENGTAVGGDLGFNLEFYTCPELSVVLGARQGFKYSFLQQENYYYFHPLFQVGVRYNIR